MAKSLGATEISISYGDSSAISGSALSALNVPIVASVSDKGYKSTDYPGVLPDVTAAGGTDVYPSSGARGVQERVWWDPQGATGSKCTAQA